jgi:hypothetical protein
VSREKDYRIILNSTLGKHINQIEDNSAVYNQIGMITEMYCHYYDSTSNKFRRRYSDEEIADAQRLASKTTGYYATVLS